MNPSQECPRSSMSTHPRHMRRRESCQNGRGPLRGFPRNSAHPRAGWQSGRDLVPDFPYWYWLSKGVVQVN
jgi:hypothetical protein